jgi:hypothetical protein
MEANGRDRNETKNKKACRIFENGKMAGQIEILQMPTEKKVG